VAAGALLTAAAATAAVLLIDLGPRAPAAFAGWSAKPTAAAADQISSAEAGCRQQLESAPGGPAGAPAPAMPTNLPVALTDVRGPFTFVVFADDTHTATCISGPQFASVAGSGSSQPAPAPSASQIAVRQSQHSSRAGSAYSFVEGRVGSAVTGATLALSGGGHVQATVQNGWFVAWWPGNAGIASATVTTASGTSTQALSTPGAPTPPPCAAGAHCASASGSGTGASMGFMSVGGSGS